MPPRARVAGLECLRCHAVYEEPRLFTGCPACAGRGVAVNLTARLDLRPLEGIGAEAFPTLPRSLWRYAALLPVAADGAVTLGEGATPLTLLERLGRRVGLPRLYVKDESQNPT